MKKNKFKSKLILLLQCLFLSICVFAVTACLVCIYWFIKFGWYDTTAFMFIPLGIFSWLIRDTIKDIRGDK